VVACVEHTCRAASEGNSGNDLAAEAKEENDIIAGAFDTAAAAAAAAAADVEA
jgi:hypothetical protein